MHFPHSHLNYTPLPLPLLSFPLPFPLAGRGRTTGAIVSMMQKTGLSSHLYNSFGEPEILDDLIDHWSSKRHQVEKIAMLQMLQVGREVQRGGGEERKGGKGGEDGQGKLLGWE